MTCRRRHDRPHEISADGGFTLVETLVAVSIITIIMTSLTALFVTTMQSTTRQRTDQTAVRLVVDQADQLRGMAVDELTDAAPAIRSVNGVDYELTWSTDACLRPAAAPDAACVDPGTVDAPEDYIAFRRITVRAEWNARACGDDPCSYTDAIIVNDAADPVFPYQKEPPPPPILTGCVDQTVTITEQIDLDVRDDRLGCDPADGVPSFTWRADALPEGLALATNGRITGTVAGAPTTVATTITVTDAFLRPSDDTLTWTVVAPPPEVLPRSLWLRLDHDAPVTIRLADFLPPGSGPDYELVDGALPAGLGLDPATGIITGTPTETDAQDYPVTIRTTDSAGDTVDYAFPWYVRGNGPNQLLLCPTEPLPFDPPITVAHDPSTCTIPGWYDAAQSSHSSDIPEFRIGEPIPEFTLWDDAYGGTSPYRFEMDQAPAWVHLDPDTGIVSGTPTEVTDGEVKFLFQLHDQQDAVHDTISVSWRVIE